MIDPASGPFVFDTSADSYLSRTVSPPEDLWLHRYFARFPMLVSAVTAVERLRGFALLCQQMEQAGRARAAAGSAQPARPPTRVEKALDDLARAAETDLNLMPDIVDAVRAYATPGRDVRRAKRLSASGRRPRWVLNGFGGTQAPTTTPLRSRLGNHLQIRTFVTEPRP